MITRHALFGGAFTRKLGRIQGQGLRYKFTYLFKVKTRQLLKHGGFITATNTANKIGLTRVPAQ